MYYYYVVGEMSNYFLPLLERERERVVRLNRLDAEIL